MRTCPFGSAEKHELMLNGLKRQITFPAKKAIFLES